MDSIRRVGSRIDPPCRQRSGRLNGSDAAGENTTLRQIVSHRDLYVSFPKKAKNIGEAGRALTKALPKPSQRFLAR
jgi:hypothetical protein